LKGTFTAAAFINNMKRMVDALVYEVRSESANISHAGTEKQAAVKKKTAGLQLNPALNAKKPTYKRKVGYGCADYKAGCDFYCPTFAEKK
jgi:DNA topoisomerase-3